MTRILYVHGALVRDGAWWWQPVTDLLSADSIDSSAVLLPSCGETGTAPTAEGPGLHADAAAVVADLDAHGPALLVVHSYGGTVVSSAAAGRTDVPGILYIDSFLPATGDSQSTLLPGPAPHIAPGPHGTLTLRPETMGLFVHDCDPALVDPAVQRLTPQSAAAFTETTTGAAWQELPTTYAVCAEDPATPPDLQREHAARAGRVVEWPTGHHPMLSRPDLVAGLVRELLHDVG